MSYRLVICLDVQANDLQNAYKKVYRAMGLVEAETEGEIQWESTDEWFDKDGYPGDLENLQETRMNVFQEENK